MSSSINVYAVPLERLTQVVGSRDQGLIDAIVEGREDFLSSIDDIDDEAEMTCADAVAELINGEASEDAPGYLYGYALEAICSHVGDELPNICPIVGAADWIEEVDRILERKRIPVRLSALVYGGSPIPIPEPDDCPFIGQWTPAEIAAAATAFQAADPADVDQATADALQQARRWVEVAAKKPGTSIVGFLS
jgi:hypothetical protein